MSSGAIIGYQNVYRDSDGDLQLGSADIDKLSDVSPWAADIMEHFGLAEIRLLPESAGVSGCAYMVKEHERAAYPMRGKPIPGVAIKPLVWRTFPALAGDKMVALDPFGNEFARIDIGKNTTATAIRDQQVRAENAYRERMLSAIEPDPLDPLQDSLVADDILRRLIDRPATMIETVGGGKRPKVEITFDTSKDSGGFSQALADARIYLKARDLKDRKA